MTREKQEKIKLFLDDERMPPTDEWVIARTSTECVRLLQDNKVIVYVGRK